MHDPSPRPRCQPSGRLSEEAAPFGYGSTAVHESNLAEQLRNRRDDQQDDQSPDTSSGPPRPRSVELRLAPPLPFLATIVEKSAVSVQR
jgi:hypothetical protein